MQIEPDEFRRRYEELSDEALLEIDRKDLTDLALSYYDAEVARRGLDSGVAAESGQPNPEMDLVPVATFLSLTEANFGRDLLRAAEIPAYFENELTSTQTGDDALRLMVPASLLEQAEEILEAEISDEELLAQAEAADPIDLHPEEERD